MMRTIVDELALRIQKKVLAIAHLNLYIGCESTNDLYQSHCEATAVAEQ
jgi:hypothetical protein